MRKCTLKEMDAMKVLQEAVSNDNINDAQRIKSALKNFDIKFDVTRYPYSFMYTGKGFIFTFDLNGSFI